MTPEPNQKSTLFPRFGSKFRYSGRTHYETKKTPIERPAPQFERSLSGRRLTSRSMDRKLHFIKHPLFLLFFFLVLYFYLQVDSCSTLMRYSG